MSNELLQQAVDNIADVYDLCVKKAKDMGWFENEQAIQAAGATLFINLSREYPTLNNLEKQLRSEIEKYKASAKSSVSANSIPSSPDNKLLEKYVAQFKPYCDEFGPRIKGVISNGIKLGYNEEQMKAYVDEYVAKLRNAKN